MSFWEHLMNLPVVFRKLLPTIVLLVIGGLAGATDVFSEQVRLLVTTTLKQRVDSLMPMVLNLLVVLILFNIAYLLYHPALCGLEHVLQGGSANDRAKNFILKAVRLGYWLFCGIVIVSLFAPELMGKVVLGFGVLGAAITLALQDAAKNFISGLRVQSTIKLKAGDKVKSIGGADVEGIIVEIGYLSTFVETKNGLVIVPNTILWEKAVLKVKPEPSKLILPDGWDKSDDDMSGSQDNKKGI